MLKRDAKQLRREEAEERMALRTSLTPTKQLEQLDSRLGVGAGAKKERSRLLKQLAEG